MLGTQKILKRNFKEKEFYVKMVSVRRVVRVVKGGRIFSCSCFVLIGNKKGYIGYGLGKSKDQNDAKSKAENEAKRNIYFIPKKGTTIHHIVFGKFCASKVVIRPAKKGTGIVAGGAMRQLFELLGIDDVVAKSIGSSDPQNLIKASVDALMKIRC
jgi:small subunit ribosomal protein S5